LQGLINGDGTVAFGTGFTITHDDTGAYTIVYDTPAGSIWNVIAMPYISAGSTAIGTTTSPTASSIQLNNSAGDAVDLPWAFIATGAN